MSRRGLIAQGLAGACLAVMVSGLWSAATEAAEADVVLRNGKIYTADKERSIRQAIALKGNSINHALKHPTPDEVRQAERNCPQGMM